MNSPRRRFLHLVSSAVALSVLPRAAKAQAYPARPVRVIVPVAPGGGTDIIARTLAQWLSERLGQPFVIDNRPGAGGNTGTEVVVKAPADGYTLLLVNAANATNAALFNKLPFNFIRDIAPVSGIDRQPYAVVVNPSFPAKSVSEMIAYAKANPGKVNMASAGNGTGGHVAGELFKMQAGVDLTHVPYRGSAPALADLIAGHVQISFASMTTSIEQIRSGALRALAVTTSTRSEALPDVPTVSDVLPGFEASFWTGIGVPTNTPAEIVGRLNRAINAAIVDPHVTKRIAALGGSVLAGSPSDFAKLIADETDKWAKVIKFAGIKAA